MRRARDSGFTLVELIVVIVIIGVLSAVILLAASKSKPNAPAACAADFQTVRTAAESYYSANANTFASSLVALRTSGHLRASPPARPSSGPITKSAGPNGYVLDVTASSADPTVYVWGADRTWGTADDASGGSGLCAAASSGL